MPKPRKSPATPATVVVKAQRSIDPPGRILIYTRARPRLTEERLITSADERIMGAAFKIFAKARIRRTDQGIKFTLIERTEDQSW